jgi:predicted enzyme related to lactoylglutathione lyase
MKRAIDFYTNIIGLKLTSQDEVARFDIDGVLFELVPAQNTNELKRDGNGCLCLRVENIFQAIEELNAKDVPTSPIQKKDNGMLASFKDTDGNEICLWQYR